MNPLNLPVPPFLQTYSPFLVFGDVGFWDSRMICANFCRLPYGNQSEHSTWIHASTNSLPEDRSLRLQSSDQDFQVFLRPPLPGTSEDQEPHNGQVILARQNQPVCAKRLEKLAMGDFETRLTMRNGNPMSGRVELGAPRGRLSGHQLRREVSTDFKQ